LFDTVRITANCNSLNISQIRNDVIVGSFIYKDSNTGMDCTKFKLRTNNIPMMEYNTFTQRLVVELSIPKFLYRENVTNLKQKEIETFFSLLEEELYQNLSVRIDKTEWQIKRIDVSWNFQAGHKVTDYLNQLKQMEIPRLVKTVYQDGETVSFGNKSRETIFYDKQKQCKNNKDPVDIVKRAYGLLRMEIRPSYHEMRKYDKERKAVNLLTKDFFIYLMEKVLPIEIPLFGDDVPYEWVVSHKIHQIEKVIGFKTLRNNFGMVKLKQIYRSSTLDNRKKLMKKIEWKDTALPPLQIDYTQL